MSLAELKAKARIDNDHSFSVRAWIETATKLVKEADALDSQGRTEEAYVAYLKVAGISNIIIQSSDRPTAQDNNTQLFAKFSQLRNKLPAVITRVSQQQAELEDKFAQQDAENKRLRDSKPTSMDLSNDASKSPTATKSAGIGERLAALRQSGMVDTTISQRRLSKPTTQTPPSASTSTFPSNQSDKLSANSTGTSNPVKPSIYSIPAGSSSKSRTSPVPNPQRLPSMTDIEAHFPTLAQLERDAQVDRSPRVEAMPSKTPSPAVTPMAEDSDDLAGFSLAHITEAPHRAHQPPIKVPRPMPPIPSMPFMNAMTPVQLLHVMSTPAYSILLLDVRSPSAYNRAHIPGKCVNIDPISIRPGISSVELETSLSMNPRHEQELFSIRAQMDIIVIYDEHSTNVPTSTNIDGATEEKRRLKDLIDALYSKEFIQPLQKPPVLLLGGWKAWNLMCTSQGIISGINLEGEHVSVPETNGYTAGRNSLTNDEIKKANRKASIIPPPRNYDNNDVDEIPYAPPLTTHPHFTDGTLNGPISMPATALYRTGPASPYDAYPTSTRTASSYPPEYSSPPPAPRGYTNGYLQHDYFDPHNATGSRSQPSSSSPQYMSPTSSRPHISYPSLQRQNGQSLMLPASHSSLPPTAFTQGDLHKYGAPQMPPPVARPMHISSPPLIPQALASQQSYPYIQNPSSTAVAQVGKHFTSFGDGAVGKTGLENLGNTCYMNSTIQCLSATIPFARYMKDGKYKKAVNVFNPLGTKGVLAETVATLFGTLWSQQYRCVSPKSFREAICQFAPQFRGSDQHDSQEFLAFLLDGLHEDLNLVIKKPPPPPELTEMEEAKLEQLPRQIRAAREWNRYLKRDDSAIVRIFQGQYMSRLKCLTCGMTSTTFNTFMYLSLPVPKTDHKITVQQCLDAFVHEEILDKDDAWSCPRCKVRRKASKTLSISRLPPVLLIHLKRFSFTRASDKIDTFVKFPVRGLDLGNYVPPPLPPSTYEHFPQDAKLVATDPVPNHQIYDLHAVSNHFGTLSSGHYTAFIRDRMQWVEISDINMKQSDEKQVQDAGEVAYILYYARRS